MRSKKNHTFLDAQLMKLELLAPKWHVLQFLTCWTNTESYNSNKTNFLKCISLFFFKFATIVSWTYLFKHVPASFSSIQIVHIWKTEILNLNLAT